VTEGKNARGTRGRQAKPAARGRATTFTEEERAAMREYARERRVNQSDPAEGEREVLAKIAEMPESDRSIAGRLHQLVKATAPHLTSRTWYGMPAYAQDGAVLLFFQSAQKFKTRYATLGFSDKAKLDEGGIWPTVYALKEFGPAEAARVEELLRRAVG
jgi:uncharacterized protein YdhG (YjbR/CyaY superfamily)